MMINAITYSTLESLSSSDDYDMNTVASKSTRLGPIINTEWRKQDLAAGQHEIW